MDKNEFWFLDAVVQHPLPLFFLNRKDDLEFDLNRDDHDLPVPEITEILLHLFERGDIVGYGIGAEDFTPTRTQIENGYLHHVDISKSPADYDDPECWAEARAAGFSYQLTPQGGAAWEKVARPDWNLFHSGRPVINAETYQMDANNYQVEATQRAFIEQMLPYYSHDKSVLVGTQQWEVLESWQPTYWKILPTAQRLKFRFAQLHDNAHEHERWIDASALLEPWYSNPFI